MKTLLVGPGGAGKTTLRKIFFEQEDPLQLISQTLEPTLGVDTNQYELGTTLAIHDLAGQQLEEWLHNANDIFFGTDLIFCILDCQEPWEANEFLIRRVSDVRDEICPKAFLAVFLHKIDLLDPEELSNLRTRVTKTLPPTELSRAYFTSIRQDRILETFHNFVEALKLGVKHMVGDLGEDLLVKIELLNQFIEQNTLNLTDLLNTLQANTASSLESLQKLQKEGYVLVKESLNLVEIGKRGEQVLAGLKDRLYHHVQQALDQDPRQEYLHGVILSDINGRAFYVHETRPDYFKTLLTERAGNSDPGLISMFFTAIKDFGHSLDVEGLDLIHLQGHATNVDSHLIEKIFGIFFLDDRLRVNEGISRTLRQFLGNIYEAFQPQIDHFLERGDLGAIMESEDDFVTQFAHLNHVLQNVAKYDFQLPAEQVIQLHHHLTEEQLDQVDPDQLRRLLLHYVVTGNPALIDQIHSAKKRGS